METSCKQTQSVQNKIIKELEAAPDVTLDTWSDFEKDVVRKYYNKKDINLIAKLVNKTRMAVQRQASYLGVTRKHK